VATHLKDIAVPGPLRWLNCQYTNSAPRPTQRANSQKRAKSSLTRSRTTRAPRPSPLPLKGALPRAHPLCCAYAQGAGARMYNARSCACALSRPGSVDLVHDLGVGFTCSSCALPPCGLNAAARRAFRWSVIDVLLLAQSVRGSSEQSWLPDLTKSVPPLPLKIPRAAPLALGSAHIGPQCVGF